MATITVPGFKTTNGTIGALDKIHSLQKRQVNKVNDAAIVTRPGGG